MPQLRPQWPHIAITGFRSNEPSLLAVLELEMQEQSLSTFDVCVLVPSQTPKRWKGQGHNPSHEDCPLLPTFQDPQLQYLHLRELEFPRKNVGAYEASVVAQWVKPPVLLASQVSAI